MKDRSALSMFTRYAAWSAAVCIAAAALGSMSSFYAPVQASIAATSAGTYPTSRGGDFMVVKYTYEWGGVTYPGVGSILARKSFRAPFGPKARESAEAWLKEHPAGSRIEIAVFKPYPAISGFEMTSGDWFARFILPVIGAWLAQCAVVGGAIAIFDKYRARHSGSTLRR